MGEGWIVAVGLACFVAGVLFGAHAIAQDQKQSVRAGVMVIDGTAYVLIPAKRGVE